MMKAAICAVIVAVCVARVSALDCYKCEDCTFSGTLSFLSSSETCATPDFNVFGAATPKCLKEVEADGTVNRRCSTQAECDVTTLFTRCDSPEEVSCRICCDTDKCNSAVTAKMAWFALALASVLAILAPRF